MTFEVLTKSRSKWAVWKTTYATYEEISRDGDKPRVLIASGLSFEDAQAMVFRLGFGHSMHLAATDGGGV